MVVVAEAALVALGQIIQDPSAPHDVERLAARRRAELSAALAPYPGQLSAADALSPYDINSRLADYLKAPDEVAAAPMRTQLVTNVLQGKYTTGNAKLYFDKLLAYKADASQTEPILLGGSKNPKSRRSMHLCIAAVGLESGAGDDEDSVVAGKSKIDKQRTPDPVRLRLITVTHPFRSSSGACQASTSTGSN